MTYSLKTWNAGPQYSLDSDEALTLVPSDLRDHEVADRLNRKNGFSLSVGLADDGISRRMRLLAHIYLAV